MTQDSDLAALVDRLQGVRVLTVGDLMLDRFVYGTVERISPEAPVPVLRIDHESAMLGGVGNVARNLRALNASVCLVAMLGQDEAGREVKGLLQADLDIESNLIEVNGRPTTIKTRYIAGSQQMLRADREDVSPAPDSLDDEVVDRAEADLSAAKAIVLSDYGKGVLTKECVTRLIKLARQAGVPVVVDPKGHDYGRYMGADLVTPNRRELTLATGLPTETDEDVTAAARRLIETSGVRGVLVTRSQDGMTLVRGEGPMAGDDGSVLHLSATAREVFDVSGAGDTVVATVAAGLAAGIDLADACRLANAAAGIVVGKIGTATASAEEVVHALHNRDLSHSEAKTATLETARSQVARWQAQGRKVGFTNGCFDLLHPGHVSLLRQAAERCDKLIVGLNSDASVARLKGPERPVQSEAARAAVLGSLASVDLVVIFGDDTPIELITTLRPNLLVKGADYTQDTVVGADVVKSYGGSVFLASLEAGFSTTATIAKLGK
jgi:D-beta-D-heptose 7-phosphate kinase / D-beta-D-heptose 1-phosphate adenosyltransferase